jgi:undecaprenyl pyrophosphate phosphatase UppP
MGGLALGIRWQNAILILTSVPTLIPESGFDLIISTGEFSTGQFGVLLVGFVISILVALATIRLPSHTVKNLNQLAWS